MNVTTHQFTNRLNLQNTPIKPEKICEVISWFCTLETYCVCILLSFSLTAMTAGTRGAFLVVILELRFVRHQPCCFINVDLVHVSLIPFIDTGYILYKRSNQLKDSLLHEVKELTYKPTWRKNRQWRHTSFYQPRSHEVMPRVQTLADPCSSRIWAFSKIITAGPVISKMKRTVFRQKPINTVHTMVNEAQN